MSSRSRRTEEWYRESTRWTQLTFVEDDPLTFDLDAWREVMVRTRSNAICLSAGGYIAYYPTAIPFHHRSVHLGDRDLVGEVVETARSLGMRVMARVDPHAVHADAAAANPEWLARDARGEAVAHPSHPTIWLTCAFSDYHREFLTDVAREIVRDYDVDAIFANRWEGSVEISYSRAAMESFRATAGMDLPRRCDVGDPAWQAYTAWRSAELSDLVALWDRAVREIDPYVRFIPNRGMWQTRGLDEAKVARSFPAFFIDKQGRSGDEAAWAAGRVGKRCKGLYPDRPVNLITSVGPEQHEHRWKDSVDSPGELTTAIVDGFLHEANPWFTKFNANIVDDRWIAPIAEANRLHAIVEPAYRRTRVAPEVLVLDSVLFDDNDTFAAYTAKFPADDGFYQALVEARVPFGYISDRRLSPEALDGVRVLVLPGSDALDEAGCAVIRDFVERGGSVVAAHTATLVDERGRERDDFALADLFGVRLREPFRDGVKNNYIAIQQAHTVATGYDGASRILGGTQIASVEVTADDAVVPFRFIPDFPDLPMEEVYPRQAPRDPAVVCRQTPSGGRVAYVAFNLGEIFWEALQLDHGRLIANLVEWACGGRRAVRVHGVGLADVAVRVGAGSTLVAIANIDNPMSMRGQIHQVRPLPGQRVEVSLPAGTTGATGKLLVADRPVVVEVRDGRAFVDVPEIKFVEVVSLEWTSV